MNKKSFKKIIAFLLILIILTNLLLVSPSVWASDTTADYYVNLSTLTYYENGETTDTSITTYSSNDFDTFVTAYNDGSLPKFYITEFLFDGVGRVNKVSKDDDTGEVTTKTISTTAININCTGSIEFTGTATDTMIAIDTNGVTEDITLSLNGIDLTSSSSTPAIMIYNKDVTYSSCNVTISTVENTHNYISGGKLKKVSTMTSDKVDEYTSISSSYSDTSSEYYYIFSSDEVSNILYAQETADSEKVAEGDPYTYYKYSGAIGSDITVNFEGKGYLVVASQSDEGIEVKGNINFIGGTGDYNITSYDDGINASTTGTDILINVNSMYVSVSADGDEGDAIDSNGTIHIEGGNIYAFSHPTSQDDGLDSDQGTYINGGTVIATGNMSDSISDNSSQEFIKLNFAEQQSAGTVVCLTDTSGNAVMSFTSDRTFTTLTYSSADLEQTTYYVYKNGVQQQWSNSGSTMGNFGENAPDGNDFPPDNGNGENPPDKPDGDNEGNNTSSSDITYSGNTEITEDTTISSTTYTSTTSTTSGDTTSTDDETSIEFTLTSLTHTFNNVTNYASSTDTDSSDTDTSSSITTTSSSTASVDNTTASGIIPYTGNIRNILKITIFVLIIMTIICFIKYKSYDKNFK